MYNCCTLNNTLIDIDMQSNDSMNSPIHTVLSTNENSLEISQATVSPSVSSSSSYYSHYLIVYIIISQMTSMNMK